MVERTYGGINMVDPAESGFDYTGTEVYRNTIRSEGGRIKVAVAMGPMVWGFACGGVSLNEGAMVYDNHVEGSNLGFGYVLNGVRNWQFFNNTAAGTFSGSPLGCKGGLATPRAFACQQETVNDGQCPAGTDVITYPVNLDGVIHPTDED